MKPPICKKIEKTLSVHGHDRQDPYYWLNDREDQEVIDYLNAENDYTKWALDHTKDFQEELFEEIKSRIKKTDMSVPYFKNGYWYYTRFEEGKEYPIYCRKKESQDNEELILLDVNQKAKGHDFYQVGGISISPDNKRMAFGVDTLSRRIYDIHFVDLESNKILGVTLKNTMGGITWANDNETVFYSIKDEALRPYKVMRHKVGKTQEEDVEVYHEPDETYRSFVTKSRSNDFIMIGSTSTVADEYSLLNANNPTGELKVFMPRKRGHEYSLNHFNNAFYLLTNEGAKNFKFVSIPEGKEPSQENWKELVPHREDVLLEGSVLFNDRFAIEERENGITEIRLFEWDSLKNHRLSFHEDARMVYIGNNPDPSAKGLRFHYNSLTTPDSVYTESFEDQSRTLLKQQEVLDPDFSPEKLVSERKFAKAADGTLIPLSIVYRKDKWNKGHNPCLIYGYGSYGHSMDPYFSSVRLSLLNRGFVYVIAHVRGGQEMGRSWYEDGKLLKKRNTFTDFMDASAFLLANGYSHPRKLMAMGGSAGGLLMGAIINERPELYKAVSAQVPFVDVVTTMLDESIPLTTGEFDEWGNPKNKEYYDYMMSYSPYDNIKAQDYPAMLVTTGLHDSQVQYWEPAKWVARLREMKTNDSILLLETNMKTGHSGASGRFERLRDIALIYSFLIDQAK